MANYKKWLPGLPMKLQEKTKPIMDKLFNKYKKSITVSFCATTLFVSAFSGALTDYAQASSLFNIEKVYHVYLDGERLGSVDDDKLVDRVISEKIAEHKEEYEHLDLVAEDIQLIEELVFKAKTDNSKTLHNLKEKLKVVAEAVAVKVEDKEISYLASSEDYEKVLEQLYLQYVSEEELRAVREASEKKKKIAEPEVGESVILNIGLSKEIDSKKTFTEPVNILSVEDTIKQLNLGTLEEDKYIVESGDVLGKIAVKHGLSIHEILDLNPSITEDTLLQIGDELNVTVYEPIVKVIIEERQKTKEEIPFQTETKEDPNMFKGDTKVQQAGEKGERVVSYSITRENGTAIKKEVITETVKKEPVNRVVVKGTKVVPSRGSGSLVWPTVGGYISSYQGPRWGKYHKGIDIARPSNRSILAADNGTVSFVGWDGGYGNKVIINHNNGIKTLYAHLSSIDVRVGQTVAKGQKIGVMGSTGNSTGIHLHFEVYQNGQLKNPMDYLK